MCTYVCVSKALAISVAVSINDSCCYTTAVLLFLPCCMVFCLQVVQVAAAAALSNVGLASSAQLCYAREQLCSPSNSCVTDWHVCRFGSKCVDVPV